MKRLLFALLFTAAACGPKSSEPPKTVKADASETTNVKPVKSAADLEKEKAKAHPYPSDLGPDSVSLEGANAEVSEGYALLRERCSVCHTAARPLNHRFAEPRGGKEAVAKMKESSPEFFSEKTIWQVEAGLWQRYVKRMMAKPGCEISKAEGKKIWRFLVWDSETRKLGSAAPSWKKHRAELLRRFQAEHPKRFDELAALGSL